jgi:Tfp pilus assembly protein PilF
MVLENARAIDDRDPAVWNRLGVLELSLGNRAQALESFKTAAALGPDYPEARANYGALLADAEDFSGAVIELEAAARYAPRTAGVFVNLGNAYRGTQQFDRAEAAYRRALELDPSLTDVEFNLAVLYLDGDRPGTPALTRLEQAVAFFDAYERKGGQEAKIAEYRKDAAKAIERERKRLAREERDRLRREAEARKKEEEARKEAELARAKAEAEREAAEEAQRKAVEEAALAPRTVPAANPDLAPAVEPAAASTTATETATGSTTPIATETAAATQGVVKSKTTSKSKSKTKTKSRKLAQPGEERGDK